MSGHKDREQIIAISADIIAAYVSNNPLPTSQLPDLIDRVYQSLSDLSGDPQPVEDGNAIPAVPIKKSVHDDYIVCLEDGQKFKSLKRHILIRYGLTPDAYRQKWKLGADYPMVAPNYAAARSKLAKAMGLGTKTHVQPTTRQRKARKA